MAADPRSPHCRETERKLQICDSPANNDLTKTELDIGIITKPYVDLAHCIRAGFCVSHALREWVRITIGFDHLGPLSVSLDPTTIRYMGTDERSILHIILRAQETRRRKKANIPYGVTLVEEPVSERIVDILGQDVLLLMPGEEATWKEGIPEFSRFAMYCPLFEEEKVNGFSPTHLTHYNRQIPRDVAILEVVHTLDSV